MRTTVESATTCATMLCALYRAFYTSSPATCSPSRAMSVCNHAGLRGNLALPNALAKEERGFPNEQ